MPEPRAQDLNKRQTKLLGKRQATKSLYFAPKHNVIPANFDFKILCEQQQQHSESAI